MYSGTGRVRIHKNGNILNEINEVNNQQNNQGMINNNALRLELHRNNNMGNMHEINENPSQIWWWGYELEIFTLISKSNKIRYIK